MKYRLIYRKEEKFVFVLNFENKECLRQEPNTEPRSRSHQKVAVIVRSYTCVIF
jgi:hypothetical protein